MAVSWFTLTCIFNLLSLRHKNIMRLPGPIFLLCFLIAGNWENCYYVDNFVQSPPSNLMETYLFNLYRQFWIKDKGITSLLYNSLCPARDKRITGRSRCGTRVEDIAPCPVNAQKAEIRWISYRFSFVSESSFLSNTEPVCGSWTATNQRKKDMKSVKSRQSRF